MPFACAPEITAHALSHGLPEPYSDAWTHEFTHCLIDGGTTGQKGVDFLVNSFPGVTTAFLGKMEPAAMQGNLSVFLEAVRLGLPMGLLFQQPGHPDFALAKDSCFSPLRVAIEYDQEDLACALLSDSQLQQSVFMLSVSHKDVKQAIKGGQLRTVANIFASPSLTKGSYWDAAQTVIRQGQPAMLDAAVSRGPDRFFSATASSNRQHCNVLFEAIACANTHAFDRCIAHGMRPWQIPVKDLDPPRTACDWLCSGRDAFLRDQPSTEDALADLARRNDIAKKLDALGFGPTVTDKTGHNAAHRAAVWRTPELLDLFLTLRPHLCQPGSDGGYPLHLVASNKSRDTTRSLLTSLVLILKRHGADMDCRDFKGDNALATAVNNHLSDVVVAMVEGGVPLQSRNHQNKPVIERYFKGGGAISKRGQFMATLLNAGFDLNETLSDGQTFQDHLIKGGKNQQEALHTARAFRARQAACDLMGEMEKEVHSCPKP